MNDPYTPPDFDVAAECNGEQHWIEVREGIARATHHGNIEEDALRALGGEAPHCVRAAEAVTRSAGQLSTYESYAIAAMKDPTRLAHTVGMTSYFMHKLKEPFVDAVRVPSPLRRLARLRAGSDGSDQKDRQKTLSMFMLNLARATGDYLYGEHPRLEVGEYAAVRMRTRGMPGPTVTLPRAWLAHVGVLGLESLNGRLTLDFDGAKLTQLVFGDGVVDVETRALAPRDLPPGLRLA